MTRQRNPQKQSHEARHEAGVALIMALLIVAMATTAIVSMINAQRIDLRRTENIFAHDQAALIAYGGEIWAKRVLTRDKVENHLDTLDETWAQKLSPMALDHGVVSGYIEDMTGRFNLNNLVTVNNQSLLDMGRFRRLLLQLGLNPDLAYAVADWIDENEIIGGPGGAEDPEYLAMTPPYRAANRPMTSTTELMMIKGFDAASYQKLAPFVTALPTYTDINVNTASPVVLRILVENLKDGDLERLLQRRKQKPFQNANDFLTDPTLAHYVIPPRGINVASIYFLVTIHARIGNSRVHLFSLLQRTNTNIHVLMRGQGVL
ncbi:MAG: type II secretion system minor pseudopilin GspK [Magnetococcales bacterium]|nr:type II secretion system minor pseudopilin GspK [Magnetococcales bacterium]